MVQIVHFVIKPAPLVRKAVDVVKVRIFNDANSDKLEKETVQAWKRTELDASQQVFFEERGEHTRH